MTLADELIRIGFDKTVANAIEYLYEVGNEKRYAKLDIDDETISEMIENKIIRTVTISDNVAKTPSHYEYQLVDLKQSIKDRIEVMRRVYEDFSNRATKLIDSLELDEQIHTRVGVVEHRPFIQIRAKRKLNVYEYDNYVEKWIEDLKCGRARKGRPPQEVLDWIKKTNYKRPKKFTKKCKLTRYKIGSEIEKQRGS